MGIYNVDGKIRLTVVDGSTYTGLYAPDGSWNVVLDPPGESGIYHPSGALNVTNAGTNGYYSINGFLNLDHHLFTGSLSPATITHLADPRVSTTDLTTYTFTAVNLGTEHAQRQIVVPISLRGGTVRHVESVTIHVPDIATDPTGTSLSEAAPEVISASTNTLAVFAGGVPLGTSGDIVVELNAATNRLGIDPFRVLGTLGTAITSTSVPLTATPTVPNRGALLAFAMSSHGTGNLTATWTELTERNDQVVETFVTQTSASNVFADGGEPTVTCTFSSTPTGNGGVFLPVGPFSGVSEVAAQTGAFGELLSTFFDDAEWTRTEKLRYAPPVLVNPIEPGTTRDETKPGTGIQAAIGTGLTTWTLNENQDGHCIGADHVTAGTRTGFFHVRNGRNVVVKGIEQNNQRFTIGLVNNIGFIEGFRGDFSGQEQDAIFVPGSVPFTFIAQNIHHKGLRCINDSVYVSGVSGTENVADVTSVAKSGGTITVTLAGAVPSNDLAVGNEVIIGGNTLGGEINGLDDFNYTYTIATLASQTSFTVTPQSSHENVPADGLTGTGGRLWKVNTAQTGFHSDSIQVVDTPVLVLDNIFIDKLTVYSNSRSVISKDSPYKISRHNFRFDTSLVPVEVNYQALWLPGDISGEFYQVWLEHRPFWGLGFAMNPGDFSETGGVLEADVSPQVLRFPDTSYPINGVVFGGVPPSGDFVDYDSVGVDYVSPGYGDTRAPQTGDITAITDDIPTEVNNALAEDGHIAWIDATYAADLADAIIDIHISTGDTDRFKMTGRELVRAGTALEADTEYLLTLTATIRGTAISINTQVSIQTSV